MTWYKFWKKSGPMAILTEDYFWLDKKDYPNNERIKDKCEDWADRIPGGHNSRYTYGYEKISKPPIRELERMIKDEREIIQAHKSYLEMLLKTHRGK